MSADCTVSSTNGISSVSSTAQLTTKRDYQSNTATKYIQLPGMRTYVISMPQT